MAYFSRHKVIIRRSDAIRMEWKPIPVEQSVCYSCDRKPLDVLDDRNLKCTSCGRKYKTGYYMPLGGRPTTRHLDIHQKQTKGFTPEDLIQERKDRLTNKLNAIVGDSMEYQI